MQCRGEKRSRKADSEGRLNAASFCVSGGAGRDFPNLAYLMLHSFAHLLISSVSLGCGYPASSIRERVYAIPELGYGVLL
jgi:hypothetical protein